MKCIANIIKPKMMYRRLKKIHLLNVFLFLNRFNVFVHLYQTCTKQCCCNDV